MFIIYLIGIADSIDAGAVVIATIMCLGTIISYIILQMAIADAPAIATPEDVNMVKKIFNRLSRYFIIATVIACLMPNSKTIAAMVLVPQLVNSDKASELMVTGSKLHKLLDVKLDSWINDLTEEKK